MKPDIIFNYNSVEIEGIRIEKPKYLGASQWIDFWDQAANVNKLANEFEEAQEADNDAWEAQVSRLEDEIDDLKSELIEVEKDCENYEDEVKELKKVISILEFENCNLNNEVERLKQIEYMYESVSK